MTAHIASMVKKYGLPMLVTSDDNLKEYLTTILSQVQGQCTCSSRLEIGT